MSANPMPFTLPTYGSDSCANSSPSVTRAQLRARRFIVEAALLTEPEQPTRNSDNRCRALRAVVEERLIDALELAQRCKRGGGTCLVEAFHEGENCPFVSCRTLMTASTIIAGRRLT